jgi:apolipoprotein N-acyltransferase
MDLQTGGPWTALANTQLDFLTLVQNAEVTGIYGITFWLILLNVSIFNWIDSPFPEYAFAAVSIFILPWLTGILLTPQPSSENGNNLDIAVVQPNIHLSQKWKPGGVRENIESLLTLSQPAIKKETDIIIWPESATSSYILQGNQNNLKWIQSKLGNSKLLSGIPYYTGNKHNRMFYNSAVLISADSVSKPYNKLMLVPMAEHIPLSGFFPSLKKLNLGQANFTQGKDYKIFNVDNTHIAAMICFESTIPSLSAEFVRLGAEILVYVVNDGWYEYPPEPQQHAKQAIYRAIENRRPVVRCTNTGISMIIEPSGNITQQLPLNSKGVINGTIIPSRKATFYTQYGDIVAQLSGLVSILLILGIFIRGK